MAARDGQSKRQWRTEAEKDQLVDAYREWRETPWYKGKPTSRDLAKSLGVSYGWLMQLVRERRDSTPASGDQASVEAVITKMALDNARLQMERDQMKRETELGELITREFAAVRSEIAAAFETSEVQVGSLVKVVRELLAQVEVLSDRLGDGGRSSPQPQRTTTSKSYRATSEDRRQSSASKSGK